MKKGLRLTSAAMTAALMACSMQVKAANTTSTGNVFNGFYVGASANVLTTSEKVKNSASGNAFLEGESSEVEPGAGLFAGYGRLLSDKFYLGGELFINSGHKDTDGIQLSGVENKIDDVETDFSYGAALRGGIVCAPKTMLYVLIGAENTKFKVKASFANQNVIDFSESKWGFMPGIGLETYFTDHFSARVQFTYTNFKEVNNTNSGGIETTIDPQKTTGSLQLNYRF